MDKQGKDAAAGSSSAKKKKNYNVEPRTPLKRQRVPVQRFQSPAEEMPPPKPKTPKEEVELVYKKGTFLAVRGAEGTFYLCRTQQNVFNNTKHFKIQWLDQNPNTKVYKFDFLDHTEIECVLTNVRMDYVAREQYSLPESEKERIEMILTKALKKEKGEPIDDLMEINETKEEEKKDELEEDDEEEDWEDEPTPKKKRVSTKGRKSVTVSLKAGKDSKNGKKQGVKRKSQSKKKESKAADKKKQKGKKPTEKKERKRGPDRKLKPNLKIKILEKDPLFETKDHVPFISKYAHQRLVFRAVKLKDKDLLEQLLADDQHIRDVFVSRSLRDTRTPLEVAVENNDVDSMTLLLKDKKQHNNPRLKNPEPEILLSSIDTGTYNRRSLGVAAVAKLSVGRGSREGNQAFLKETSVYHNMSEFMVTKGVKKETIDAYFLHSSSSSYEKENMYECIHDAVIHGHRELAGKLMEEALKKGGYGFNELHKNVLLYKNEDLGKVLAVSARKKPFANAMITPIHCACINPNAKYLKELLAMEPDYNMEDRMGRKPIHYAAACQGTEPLELLLKMGANPNDMAKGKVTPLLFACHAGRAKNADILIKRGQDDKDNPMVEKYGPAGLNQADATSTCPIHIAVENADKDLLSVLLKYGVDVNKHLSAGKEKLTPLMIAAARGHLDMARRLVQGGAIVEKLDKFKRSALTHAVMNGNANVASYLLYLGSDPNRTDSSGNSLVHYAAAYGWYFVLKLLVNEGGADAAVANDWQLTPVGAAFMKGHTGLVDFLLKLPGVDINFKNDHGMTLISVACTSNLVQGLQAQIEYLLDKGADPTIPDINGFNALHHLCGHEITYNRETFSEWTVKIAQLLIKAGCDPKQKTAGRQTAITIAISKVNLKLVKFLVEKGGSITTEKNERGQNSLHLLANQCLSMDLTPFLAILGAETNTGEIKENGLDEKMEVDEEVEKGKTKTPDKASDNKTPDSNAPDNNVPSLKKEQSFKSTAEALKMMATEVDHDGYTPLLLACKLYMQQAKQRHRPGDLTLQQQLEHGLGFIKMLLDTTGVGPSQSVQKKHFPEDAAVPDSEKAQYADKYGKYTAIHFMMDCGSNNKQDGQRSQPGLGLGGLQPFGGLQPSRGIQPLGGFQPLGGLQPLGGVQPLGGLPLGGGFQPSGGLQLGGAASLQSSDNPGLTLILKYKPSLEVRNLDDETPLVQAVKQGTLGALSQLIKAGANVNTWYRKSPHSEKDTDQKTLLTTAAEKGNLAMVKMLVDAGADVNNNRDSDSKWTALHYCVSSAETTDGKIAMAGYLLDAGADINSVDKLKRTPLHLAVSHNSGTSDASTDLEDFLIQKKAGLFNKCWLERFPLHYAFDKIDKYGESSSLDPIELCTVLTSAMDEKRIDEPDKYGQTPLHLAAQRGASICCLHLVQRKAEMSRKDNNGNTPLALTVSRGHDSCAIVLIQKGADVSVNVNKATVKVGEKEEEEEEKENKKKDDRPVWRWKPLRKITEKEDADKANYSVFQESIKRELQGVSHMILDAGEMDARVIEAALNVGKFNVVQRLLKRIKDVTKVQRLNKKGQNLLHILGMSQGSPADIIKAGQVLMQKGVSFTQTDEYGCTPLHYVALSRQKCEVARFYMDNNKQLDINKKDKFDRDVLAAYLWKYLDTTTDEHENWLRLLISKGASLNNLYDFPVSEVPTFDCTIDQSWDYFTTTSTYRISPLIMAINSYKFSFTRFLIQNGASSDFADSQGLTPLMHAVRKNDENLVKLLLNNDYSPEQLSMFALTRDLSRTVFGLQAQTMNFNVMPTATSVSTPLSGGSSVSDNQSDNSSIRPKCKKKRKGYTGFIIDSSDEVDEDEEEEENFLDQQEEEEEVVDQEEEGSEGGTDILEEEEEEEAVSPPPLAVPSLVRLQSKQPSINQKNKESETASTIEKTSSINLNATDPQGWTVLHHLVCPLELGSFDNVDLLKLLVKVGADYKIKDNAGLSPLDHALVHGAASLAAELQEMAGVDEDKWEKPVYPTTTDSPDPLLATKVDYKADSDAMVKKLQDEAMETDKDKEENRVKPDPNCNIKNLADVLYDDKNEPYDVLLSKVDVSYGEFGLYNFYKMQVLRQKGLDLYVLFTRWGRIGDDGQYQHTAFQKKDEAVAEFCKIFRSKTGNHWSDIKSFEKQPKKYRIVQWEPKYGKSFKSSLSLNSDVPSKLPAQLQDLMKDMSNVSMIQGAMRKAGLEEEFGNLKKENLIKAREILQQIGELIQENANLLKGSMDNEKTAKHQSNCEQISVLSSEYYSLVPVENYSFEKIPPIDNFDLLKEKLRTMHDLLDLECASRILLGAQTKVTSTNPLDYVYQAMECRIQPLLEDSIEAQYILKYIHSSGERTKVHAIYKLGRQGEEERIRNLKLDNHHLLWHGSSVANFISILHRGLLVAPPEVPITGHLFGQGIYTSDAFSKSLGYCYNPTGSKKKLALLCEVALGECMLEYRGYHSGDTELRDTEYNSKYVQGRYVPNKDFYITLPNGSVMPLGMLEDQKKDHRYVHMHYSEFIVENPSQVCLRYLVEFS